MSFRVSWPKGRSQPIRSISGAERAHHGGQRLGFLFVKFDHVQSSFRFDGERRLAAHGAEPAAGAGALWARPLRIEPAEAAGAGCADGANRAARMPEAIKARANRSLCGRGLDLRDMAHAAARAEEAALRINCRIARLLKVKVMSAEAL